jgi:hypothetical protein
MDERVPTQVKTTGGAAAVVGVSVYFVLRLFVFPDLPFWILGAALAVGCVVSAWLIIACGVVPLLRSWHPPRDEQNRDA